MSIVDELYIVHMSNKGKLNESFERQIAQKNILKSMKT